ncbi:protein MRG1 [Cocos nucifera]|uniref:Protein MRG1 n=1 Tax=Cocos nucifera TaxID=13894 RepID=A0A8K0HV57_COCNU|nr:protein MRG1 [Cocos nucifera]
MGSSYTGGGNKDESTMEGGGGAKAEPSASDSPAAGAFSEGEKVLAYHGPRIYEAKCQPNIYRYPTIANLCLSFCRVGARSLKVRSCKVEFYLKIIVKHRPRKVLPWDEWVGTDRLMKFSPENVRMQQELAKNQNADKIPKSGRSIQNKPKGSNDAKADKEDLKNHVSKGKKRKAQFGNEEKDTKSAEKLVILQFPLTLKKQLVDDWEFVTQLGKLVKLPRSPNIDDILKKYLDYRTKKDGLIAFYLSLRITFCLIGVGYACFPGVIGTTFLTIYCESISLPPEDLIRLLFPVEFQKKDKLSCHLSFLSVLNSLKMFGFQHIVISIKLPELLAYVNMEEEALAKLQQKLVDFLKYGFPS